MKSADVNRCSLRTTLRIIKVNRYCFLLVGLLGGVWASALGAAADKPVSVELYRGNIGHTGVATEKLTTPLTLSWRHTTVSTHNNSASPVYANGLIYFVSGSALYAVNAADGERRWQYPTDKSAQAFFGATPTLSNGFLYIADDYGQVSKLDAATGHEIWKAKLDGAIRSSPIVSNGIVYFGSGNAHAYALNAENGQTIWDVTVDGPISASPTLTGGLVVFSSSDGNVYSLSARNGHKAWAVPFDADPSIVPLVYDGTSLYVTAGDTIFRLDPGNGAKRPQIKLPTNILLPPTVSSDTIYVITQSNALYALSSSGQERWRVTLDSSATAPPLLTGNLLIVPTVSGVLSAYDAQTSKLQWRYVMQATANSSQPKVSSTSISAAPIAADGALYVVSDDGSLSAFRDDAADNIGPQLTQLVPYAGATVKSADLMYGAILVDDGTGIDPGTVQLQLDGQADSQVKYHPGQNALYDAPVTPLKEGLHHLTVTAADWRGNATSQTWSFTVQDHPQANPSSLDPNNPNFPGRGGHNPNAPPPPPPIGPF